MSAERDQQVLDYFHSNILQDGENLVWKGRPSPFRAMAIGTVYALLGVLCAGFFFAVRTVDLGVELGWAYWIYTLIMVFGLWLMTAPLRFGLKARRTYYAITDRRIVFVQDGRKIEVNSVFADDIFKHELTDRGNNTGEIRLFLKPSVSQNPHYQFLFGFEEGLWGIRDAHAADEAIAALRADAAA